MDGSDRRRLFRALRAAGFTVDVAGSGHWGVWDRHHRRVATLPSSPSDWRSWRNTLADLRRLGFAWPPDRTRSRSKGRAT